MNVSPKRRTETISIRVTPEEKSRMKAMARKAGMTLTEYIIFSSEVTVRAAAAWLRRNGYEVRR